MKKILSIGGSILLSLFLCSCSTNPATQQQVKQTDFSGNDAHLLILTELKTKNFNDAFTYYELIGNQSVAITLPVTQKFTEVDDIQEGIGYIYKVNKKHKNSNETYDTYKHGIVFYAENRAVTIFPKKAVISFEISSDGSIVQMINFKDLTESDIDDCVRYIKQQEKYAELVIYTRRQQ